MRTLAWHLVVILTTAVVSSLMLSIADTLIFGSEVNGGITAWAGGRMSLAAHFLYASWLYLVFMIAGYIYYLVFLLLILLELFARLYNWKFRYLLLGSILLMVSYNYIWWGQFREWKQLEEPWYTVKTIGCTIFIGITYACSSELWSRKFGLFQKDAAPLPPA